MSIRVMITDDHQVFRSGLRALLEKEEGIVVVAAAGDGPATLQALAGKAVDVLLLDVNLPGMSGIVVAEKVRKEFRHTAIVVLTMHEDEYYWRELFRIGVCGYVLKSSSATDTVRAIRAGHAGEQYLDPSLAGRLLQTGGGLAVPSAASGLSKITAREREICVLLAYGHTSAEIAGKLRLSPRTVETHRMNLQAKLGLQGRAELVRFAINHHLISPDR